MNNGIELKSPFSLLLDKYGVRASEVSKRFGIPYRTVQNWKGGVNPCPEYVLRMIDELLKMERG